MSVPTDRFERQRDLVPAQRLASTPVSVIGVGAIGRQVALQLASIGVRRLQLIDFDPVEATTVTTQGYRARDVGGTKVAASAAAIHEIDPAISVHAVADRFRPGILTGDAVFCCVDSIAARKAIWRAAGVGVRFWCDGRMLGETIRVLAVAGDEGRTHYPRTLFDASDAVPGRCTARSTGLLRVDRRATAGPPVRASPPRTADRAGRDARSARQRTYTRAGGDASMMVLSPAFVRARPPPETDVVISVNHRNERQASMDNVVVIVVLLALAFWAFKHGKHLGSRAGYYVGKQRGSSRRR